jgi:hypothetical protein
MTATLELISFFEEVKGLSVYHTNNDYGASKLWLKKMFEHGRRHKRLTVSDEMVDAFLERIVVPLVTLRNTPAEEVRLYGKEVGGYIIDILKEIDVAPV